MKAAVLTAAVFFLVSCSRSDDKNAIHFLLWKPHQPRPIEQAIARFEELNPGVRIIRHIGSENASEYYRELTTKLRNRDPDLDVFFLDVTWPAEFAARGYLADLSDRLRKEDRASFFPGPMAADTIDGRVVAVPYNIDVGLLFYRKDLLARHGFNPPATWDDLIRQIDTILVKEGKDRSDLIGYSGQFDKYEGLVCNMLEFIESGGGSFLDQTGRPAVTRPEVIETVRFVRDELIHNAGHPRRAPEYLLTAKEQESREIFARGDAVFLRNWPETWGLLNDPERSSVSDRVGMAPLPKFKGGKHVGALGGWQLGIASHSRRKDPAWRFIEFMASHETQRKLALGTSQTMARLTIYDDKEILESTPQFGLSGPWGAPLRDIAMVAMARPRSIRYNALSERIQQCFYDAIRVPDSDIEGLMSQCAVQMERETARTLTP